MTAELSDYKKEGGSAVVDMSTPGLRVDPEKTRRVSEASGVHIVTTTGFYSSDSWPDHFREMTLYDMENHMMSEVENGIENTDINYLLVQIFATIVVLLWNFIVNKLWTFAHHATDN